MYLEEVNKYFLIKSRYFQKLRYEIKNFYIIIAIQIIMVMFVPAFIVAYEGGSVYRIGYNSSQFNPYLMYFLVGCVFLLFVTNSIMSIDKETRDFTFVNTRRVASIVKLLYLMTLTIFISITSIFMDTISRIDIYSKINEGGSSINYCSFRPLSIDIIGSTFIKGTIYMFMCVLFMYLINILYSRFRLKFALISIGAIIIVYAIDKFSNLEIVKGITSIFELKSNEIIHNSLIIIIMIIVYIISYRIECRKEVRK